MDEDFDPTAEMMVDDYDDERTLDEEEAMSEEDESESVGNELDQLQKVRFYKNIECQFS